MWSFKISSIKLAKFGAYITVKNQVTAYFKNHWRHIYLMPTKIDYKSHFQDTSPYLYQATCKFPWVAQNEQRRKQIMIQNDWRY